MRLPQVRVVLLWLHGTATYAGEMIWLLAEVTLFPFCGQGKSLCGNVPPQFLQDLVLKLSFF